MSQLSQSAVIPETQCMAYKVKRRENSAAAAFLDAFQNIAMDMLGKCYVSLQDTK